MGLRGRYIQLSGSASKDADASTLTKCHEVVSALTGEILKAKGGLILNVGEDVRMNPSDPASSRLFDWTALGEVLRFARMLESVGRKPDRPLARVITSQKNISKIPAERMADWDYLLRTGSVDCQPLEVNWSAAAHIRHRQAEAGDGLVILGGGEGVEHSASLYVERGRPVIPLDPELGAFYSDGSGGAARLYKHALSKPERFVRHNATEFRNKLNLISVTRSQDGLSVAKGVLELLEKFTTPEVFGIRLLNPSVPEFGAVDNFFENTVRYCMEQDFKFHLIDMGRNPASEAFINVEIFERLHYSDFVLADLSGLRHNNFFEAGYALGHGTRVLFTAIEGTKIPFDTQAVPIFFWSVNDKEEDRRRKFMAHWQQNVDRSPIVRRRDLG